MSSAQRFLGLAFAASDLLIELDARGRVGLALGAGPVAGQGADKLAGWTLAQLVSPASRLRVRRALNELTPGRRVGPVQVDIMTGDGRMRPAAFNAFSLPDAGGVVSCAVSWTGEVFETPASPVLAPGIFMDRVRDALDGDRAGEGAKLDFIDVAGLPEQGETTDRIEAAMQAAALGGETVTRLAPERYALLRDADSTDDLSETVARLGREAGLSLGVVCVSTPIEGVPPVNLLRALRLAAEDCLKDGATNPTGAGFQDVLSRTMREAEAFRLMVRDRAFEVHYQPIVDLGTGAVHHFEALSRFPGPQAPFNVIRMAEELALVESFDLAVLEKVVRRLKQPGSGLLKVAVNVSGASLSNDAYIRRLLQMTSADPQLGRRLIVEVTESAALADVEAANRRLAMLREAGVRVCIDDFGAGAAAFDYLRNLQVDTVKIDGSLIRGIEDDVRARTLTGHLVGLCTSLGMTTVAEMVETEAAAETLRNLGVDFAQGWLFGKAETEPRTNLSEQPTVRRAGAVEAWA
jgi:EAL domain-containing protein (putative c-di-GMP-specific phosphodiesterase class I)